MQPKLCFFAWEATWGKLLRLDQLQRRGLAIAIRCFLCRENEEMMDHLLHCVKTRVLWKLFLSFWDILGKFFLGLGYPFGLDWSFIAKDGRRVWKTGPLCILWSGWKARNSIVFRDEVLSIHKVKTFFCISAFVEDQNVSCEWSYHFSVFY